ncbi:MAG: tyrosine-type recombinase/integrase [Silvibacterium sp.]
MSTIKRGNIWWFEFEFRGARIRESSNSKVRAVCERLERERRRGLELGTGGLRKISGPLSASRAVDAYRKLREPHWAKRTRGIHESSWKHLEPAFGKLLLSDIQPSHISKYQRERQKEGASGRTINIEVGLIRQVMIHHRMWHAISPDVRMLREREDIGRSLTADEEVNLLAAAKKSVSRSLYPAILLSIHTGLRNEELRLLQWRQIDFLKEEVAVGKSKTAGGEGRIVPLSDTALACLKEWRGKFPDVLPEHYVFPSERYGLHGKEGTFGGVVKVYSFDPETPIAGWKSSWTTCRSMAKISCRWHDMRHTFISRCGENRIADQTLLALADQLSRKVLERYSHARNESKRAAVKMLDTPTAQNESPQFPPQSEGENPSTIM